MKQQCSDNFLHWLFLTFMLHVNITQKNKMSANLVKMQNSKFLCVVAGKNEILFCEIR